MAPARYLGNGLIKLGTGSYTLTAGSAAQVQAALQALSFTPATSSASVTTQFSIIDTSSDGLEGSTTDSVATRVSAPDLTAPAAPTLLLVTASGGTAGSSIINTTSPTVSGVALAGTALALTVNGGVVETGATPNGAGAFSAALSPALGLGQQQISAVATNAAGASPGVGVARVVRDRGAGKRHQRHRR